MQKITDRQFDEERALYGLRDAEITHCTFAGPADGESALKECENIVVKDSLFQLRYPLWHVHKGIISNSVIPKTCRAALWYDTDITIENSKLYGIKALRECSDINLMGSDVISPEFLWRCRGVTVRNTTMQSEYPFFECHDVTISKLAMKGKYSFQYVENMTIEHSNLDTKDAFWHSKNVTVTDSVIRGEYLGWYSENLKLVRCKIIGTQPLCYCKNLILEDCTMEDTDLSFERSEVHAVVHGVIEGVKNPLSGTIIADDIGEILLEEEYINQSLTEIKVKSKKKV